MDSVTNYLGPNGGALAVAFGSGCVAGYGFCMRTIYKLLQKHSEGRHADCLERVEVLEREKEELKNRLLIIEDRLFSGQERQLGQIRESTRRVLPQFIDGTKDDV